MKIACLTLIAALTLQIGASTCAFAENARRPSLKFHDFPPAPPTTAADGDGPQVKSRKAKERPLKNVEQRADVIKLRDKLTQFFGSPPDGYIRLSRNTYIVFVNAGPGRSGLYFASPSTTKVGELPIVEGEVSIEATLKDKLGREHLLLKQSFSPKEGWSVIAYSLLWTGGQDGDNTGVNTLELTWSGYDWNIACACKPGSKDIVNENVRVSVADLNGDHYPDFSFELKKLDCATGTKWTSVIEYLAGQNGFTPSAEKRQ